LSIIDITLHVNTWSTSFLAASFTNTLPSPPLTITRLMIIAYKIHTLIITPFTIPFKLLFINNNQICLIIRVYLTIYMLMYCIVTKNTLEKDKIQYIRLRTTIIIRLIRILISITDNDHDNNANNDINRSYFSCQSSHKSTVL
jgi:hypothetical protein